MGERAGKTRSIRGFYAPKKHLYGCDRSSTMFWVVPLLEKIIIRDLTNWTVLAIYTSAAIFVTAMGLIKTTVNSIWVPYVYKNYTNEVEFKRIFRQVGISLCWLCLVRTKILMATALLYFTCRFMCENREYKWLQFITWTPPMTEKKEFCCRESGYS